VTVTRTVPAGGVDRYVLPGEAVWSKAIAVARLVDAGSGLALSGVRARSLDERVVARVATGGWLALVGAAVVTDAIAAAPQTIKIELTTRLTRLTRTITVPAGASLPFAAPDIPVGTSVTAVAGRIGEAAFPNAPISAAKVSLRSTVPAGSAVALRIGVAGGHAAGTTVRARTVSSAALTTLDGDVAAGDAFIRLTSVAGVGPGTWLSLGGEVHEVVDLEVPSRVVQLRLPLLRSRHDLTPVDEATLGGLGAATTLAADAERGDTIIVTANPIADDTVEIVDGTSTEICLVGTETDAAGAYRFGTVRGLATVTVSAEAAGFTTATVTRPLDPARSHHVIDLRLAV
jgi:hypothetical protein